MKISLNWLKEYIPGLKIDSIDELTPKMISIGLDIESIEYEEKIFDKFVIGEVIEKQKHPNADKLSLCKVNIGDKILSVVCGAPNVDRGQKVCVALEDAIIPNGGFEIKRSKIRGELSEGMICSEKELNISQNHEGILILNGEAKIGEKFSDYMKMNDIIFEIGITPNRGDLFSHIGVAREIAALYDKKVSIPEVNIKESGIETTELIKITLNSDLCKRFTGRVIRNIEVRDSPEWLKKKLTAIGLRPRNNIVDITNFVMFETGQPLHAFDYDKIHAKEIIVKTATDNDKFVTLDSKERTLNSNSLMVCDKQGYSGIAGIMGGMYSEITNDTTNIFIESAYFDPVSIRKNSKKLGLQTDASQRFERGVDINMVTYASLRATQLIQQIAGGEVSKHLYDVYPDKFEKIEVGMRLCRLNELIGSEFTEEEVKKLLGKIEIDYSRTENDRMIFEIPEFRRLDLSREVDLIEEAARIYGFDNIKDDTNFNINIVNSGNYGATNMDNLNDISNHLIGRGFNQVITNPLVDEKKIKIFTDNPARLSNSISAEMNSLRSNLSYGILKVINNNYNNSGRDISLRLFELGKVFSDSGKVFKEENVLLVSLSGKRDSELIYGGQNNFDIFDIKGEVEMILSKMNLEKFSLFYYNDKVLDGIKIDIRLSDEVIGNIYKADSRLRKEFDIESEVYIAEIYLDRVLRVRRGSTLYREISKFPSVKRDLAIVVDSSVKYDKLIEAIRTAGGRLLKNLRLFDVYEDIKLGENKKSFGISLEFSSTDKTLTDEEISKVIEKIIGNLENKLGATLRA